MTDSHEFDDFPEAFAYCRRKDAPVIVRVKRTLWKLFPSGHSLMARVRAGHRPTRTGR